MKLVYFRIQPEVIITRLSGPQAKPKLEVLMDQCICVAEDDGSGVPVWAGLIPDSWEAQARTYPAKFLGIGLEEVWNDHQDVAKKILRKQVELDTGEVINMSMDDATPAGGTILENGIPPHTFYGYDPQTGLPG